MTKVLAQQKTSFFLPALFVVLFRLGLDWVYVNYVSTIFGYMGFTYKFSVLSIIISWSLLCPVFFVLPRLTAKDAFSNVILLFLIHLSYIPFTTMVAFFDSFSLPYVTANFIYWICLFVFMWFLPDIQFNKLKYAASTDFILFLIAAFFSMVIIYVSIRYTGLRFTLNLSSVYDMRSQAKEFHMPTIFTYLFSASKGANPVLLAYFLTKRRWSWSGFIIFIQILSFSINGSKTVLFSTILTVLIFYFYKPKYLSKISALFASIPFIAILETGICGGIFFTNYIIRRVFFVPNLLGYCYFDFFNLHTPDYFRQSFLRLIGFRSPYMDIDHLIGLAYFNRSELGANNGLISDAFTNFGWVGIIITPLLLVFVLKLLNACSKGIDTRIYMLSSMTIAFILVSSFLNTALLTHGILAVCFILYLLPKSKQAGD